MGKAKKGKKGTKEDEIDDDIDIEATAMTDEVSASKDKDKKSKSKKRGESEEVDIDSANESEIELSSKKKKGKKKKKVEDDEDDDIDELAKQLEDLPLDKGKKNKKTGKKSKVVDDSSDDEDDTPVKAPPKAKKKDGVDRSTAGVSDQDDELIKVKSKQTKTSTVKPKGFALLNIEGDSSDSESDQSTKGLDSEEEIDIVQKTSKKGGKKVIRSDSLKEDSDVVNADRTKEEKAGKKGKKSKKKKQEDEEDIDKVLAELAQEYGDVTKEEVPVTERVEQINYDDVITKKEKKKKKKAKAEAEPGEPKTTEEDKEESKDAIEGEELAGTMKNAAQKKKEKKEREKLKKLTQKSKEPIKKEESLEGDEENASLGATLEDKEKPTPETAELNVDTAGNEEEEADEDDDDKKKKKKKKGAKVEDTGKEKKGPGKKTIAAMQEALKKIRDDEEKAAREEEEQLRRLEEEEKARQEQLKLEQERKERKKQKEKERKERMKAEGKLLTQKQKTDRARAQALLDALKAQGLDMPNVGEKKAPRPGTRVRPNKAKQQTSVEEQKPASQEQQVEVKIVDSVQTNAKQLPAEETIDVKDSWDAESSGGEDEDRSETAEPTVGKPVERQKSQEEEEEESDKDEDEEDESEEEDSSSEESEDSEDDHKTDAERKREKALSRIHKRRQENEKNKTLDELRAAVVCVLGHVDTGKTKILDKLRRTNVQDGEAGGITQQIGATNVPIEAIKEQTKIVKGFSEVELRIPGLLIIDTPGHESFSNLRSRGSSLCDIAILVVDIMHGLEPQTIESLNLLKTKKTPFIVALNKIDRLYDWQTMNRKDVRDILKVQAPNTQLEFEQRTKEVIVQFAEQGLNAALFHENPDIRSYVSLVPTSAITGEGMGNLLALIVESCQNMLAKRLMYSEELQATVLEVKAIPGLGTTIDAILINGRLREGDTMILAGTDGPIVTQIRSLLMPQPMKELRVKNAYVEYKEIKAAQGVKIAAKELEKAIAGLNMQVAQKPDEVDLLREEVARELKHALSNIKLQDRGVYVQASTLGSLEALLEFLRTSKIPYSNIRIGPVVKKDVMKASTMLEHESQYATILAFDVKVERDAQEMADTLGVKIFQADIIYHLFDKFMAYREELKQRKREEFKHVAVFPCKMRIMPQFVFNSRDPIVVGVMIEGGIVREGTPICVPSKEFVYLGVVTSIESNHKNVESARKGQEVCIKIEPVPGEAPKMFGRHFDEKDFLISKISRQSIDACKNYFRDDLVKTDWQLMVELKKLFEIM